MDAALAAAITLTVVEPTGNGLGSDGFCILAGKELQKMRLAGRPMRCAGSAIRRRRPSAIRGIRPPPGVAELPASGARTVAEGTGPRSNLLLWMPLGLQGISDQLSM